MKPTIIAIGYAKQLFILGSREHERALLYARETCAYHVVVFTKRKENYYDVHSGNLHVHATNSFSRPHMLWNAFWISKRIIKESKKDQNPIVITAQDPLEGGWLSFLLSKVTGIYLHIQVHGDYMSSHNWVGKSPVRYLRRLGAWMLLRHAPAIRVASERIKVSLIEGGIQEEKIMVLPIRPELEVFLNATRKVREYLPITFLSLGRLAPEKDISRIIRAFEIVHAKYPETKLRIVGNGSEGVLLETLIAKQRSAGAITLLPWTADVPKVMLEADIFLLASKHEAYALTLIEALATGLPVVTTDVGCVGEVVTDGVHGVVVTEEGVDAYAKGMEKMLTDDTFRKLCEQNGRATAERLAKISSEDYARAWVSAIEASCTKV